MDTVCYLHGTCAVVMCASMLYSQVIFEVVEKAIFSWTFFHLRHNNVEANRLRMLFERQRKLHAQWTHVEQVQTSLKVWMYVQECTAGSLCSDGVFYSGEARSGAEGCRRSPSHASRERIPHSHGPNKARGYAVLRVGR